MGDSQRFVAGLRRDYPDLASRADFYHINQGFEPGDQAYCIWVNAFADAVNERISRFDTDLVKDVFDRIASFNEEESKEIQELVDVYFVENLFWKVPKDAAKASWELMPESLKALYLDFHHEAPI